MTHLGKSREDCGADLRNGTIHLTIHLSIPGDLLDSPPPTSPLLVQHPRAIFSSAGAPSATLANLLPPSFPSSSLPSVVFLLPFHPSPSRSAPPLVGRNRPKLFFPPLDPNLPLDQVLRGTAWIEFPIIQVMPKHTWIVLKAKGELGAVPLADVGPYIPPTPVSGTPAKGKLVQEVNNTAEGEANAKASMGGLADYASDDEEFNDDEALQDVGEGYMAMDQDQEDVAEEDEEGEERGIAGMLGAIEIPGGPEMMQKVSEALLADFGTVEEDDQGDMQSEEEMKEVETRR